MKVNTDFTKIFKEIHQEKWVALSNDQRQVLDFDKDLRKLTNRMDKKNDACVYMKVLRFDTEYCFSPLTWHAASE